MNNKIIAVIIVLALLGFGGYLFLGSRNMSLTPTVQRMNDTSGKPITQSHRSYELEVTSDTSNIKPNQKATITYKIKNDLGEVLKQYEVTHEKIMHFITVRHDLAYFQHLHPDYNQATGEFSVDVTFPEEGPHRIFPDFTPGDENPMKLPVTVNQDITVGNKGDYTAQNVVLDKEATKKYGDYEVKTEFPTGLKSETEVTYTLNISKNGIPVTNLEKYLGALGHSVILKEGTLDFLHTHALEAGSEGDSMGGHEMGAMEPETEARGPEVSFSTTFPEAGKYKVFTQFQHEGNVKTADYVVEVK